MERTRHHDIDVFVTPECFLDGYAATEPYVDTAALRAFGVDDHGDPYLSAAADLARSHGAYLIFGCTHNTQRGPANAAFVFGRDGTVCTVYHKTHLQTHDTKFAAGDRLSIFSTHFGPAGIMICADRRWPETVRSLALQGAPIIFNPTYGMRGGLNEAMMRTRSFESEVYICFCHPNLSLITGPSGEIEARLTSNVDHYLVQEIDLERALIRRRSPSAHLRDMRADLYTVRLPGADEATKREEA